MANHGGYKLQCCSQYPVSHSRSHATYLWSVLVNVHPTWYDIVAPLCWNCLPGGWQLTALINADTINHGMSSQASTLTTTVFLVVWIFLPSPSDCNKCVFGLIVYMPPCTQVAGQDKKCDSAELFDLGVGSSVGLLGWYLAKQLSSGLSIYTERLDVGPRAIVSVCSPCEML